MQRQCISDKGNISFSSVKSDWNSTLQEVVARLLQMDFTKGLFMSYLFLNTCSYTSQLCDKTA